MLIVVPKKSTLIMPSDTGGMKKNMAWKKIVAIVANSPRKMID